MPALLTADLLALALRLAEGQSGLISHAQLRTLGVSPWTIKRLRERGWLRPTHRGVYRVGGAPRSERARLVAGVLAYAPDAYITHRDSLASWQLVPVDETGPVDVTVLGRKCRSRPGIVVHRANDIAACDLGRHRGIPLTMPARALLESAHELGMRETEGAVDEALALGLVDRPRLLAVLDRYPRHSGAAIIRALADPNRASEITASEAERALARLLVRASAPPSHTQYPIGPYRADRAWPGLRLIIEVDGVRFHRDRKRMEADNRRADDLRHWGWVVVRFTRRQVVYEPEYVLLRIGQELALRTHENLTREGPPRQDAETGPS